MHKNAVQRFTFFTLSSGPSSSTPSVTLTSHMIACIVISTMSYTLFATIISKPPFFAICLKKTPSITFVRKSNLIKQLTSP